MHEAGAHQVRRALGLARALGGHAALLAAAEREDGHLVAFGGVAQEDAADADLDVVGMRADGEDDLAAAGAPVARERDELAGLLDERDRVDRLGHVVVGAGAQGGDRVVERGARGDDEHRDVGLRGLDLADEVEPAHAGQLDVRDHEVPRLGAHELGALLAVHRPAHGAVRGEELHHHGGEDVVVLDEEDVRLG